MGFIGKVIKLLNQFVIDFAKSMEIVDKTLPPARNVRTREEFDRGIGPYQEKLLIEHVVNNMKENNSSLYSNVELEVKYPNDRKRCDVVINDDLFI